MTPATQARVRLAASLAAITFLVCAGIVLWRPSAAEREWIRLQREYLAAHGSSEAPRVREISVEGALERCTTCHLGAHEDRSKLRGAHPVATFGCVACHGGEAVALDRETAHRGLARLGRDPAEVPEIEARCAICHTGPLAPTSPSPARAAWARFRSSVGAHGEADASEPAPASDPAPVLAAGRALFRTLRCGACHASTEPALPATPMRVLSARSSPAQRTLSLREHAEIARVPIADDEIALSSLAAHLVEIAQPEVGTAALHRASIPGSNAAEGRVLLDRLACDACHTAAGNEAGAFRLDRVTRTRTADWIAHFLVDPARANPATSMPSLRITPREAASLASALTSVAQEGWPTEIDHGPVVCPTPGEHKSMPRAACGQALATAMRCSACHSSAIQPAASSLLRYGETHDGVAALRAFEAHGARAAEGAPRFTLSDAQRRALATFLVSERAAREPTSSLVPRGDRWESGRGAALYADLGCRACHESDAPKRGFGPSLFGEGLRVRPQWLFSFLLDPARHAVRPAFHPEWGYRDLVPPDHASARMPSYRLSEKDATDLVHFFAVRDGATYPYAEGATPVLTGDTLTSAIGDLTHKDRGACLGCHTVGVPDVERARAEGDKLAPPLSLAHVRLRPEWIGACILQPDVWADAAMPALVRDPLGPPLPWPGGAASEPPTRALEQIERLRDLLLMLRDKSVLPPAGAEATSPALGLGEP